MHATRDYILAASRKQQAGMRGSQQFHRSQALLHCATSHTAALPSPPHPPAQPSSAQPNLAPPTLITKFHIAARTSSASHPYPKSGPSVSHHNTLAYSHALPGSVHLVSPPKMPHMGRSISTSCPNLRANSATSDATRTLTSARTRSSTLAAASRAAATCILAASRPVALRLVVPR